MKVHVLYSACKKAAVQPVFFVVVFVLVLAALGQINASQPPSCSLFSFVGIVFFFLTPLFPLHFPFTF